MEAILIAVVVIAVVMFFKKQFMGVAHTVKNKVERNIPLEAKIDRTVSDLKAKKTNIAYGLKELYKSKAIIREQRIKVENNEKMKDRYEKLKATEDKLEDKANVILTVVEGINDKIDRLESEKGYVAAMATVSGIKDIDIDLEIGEIFAEIEAVEKMFEVM